MEHDIAHIKRKNLDYLPSARGHWIAQKKSEIKRLFHELMNQYQACLYLFQYVSHCDSKYGHEISLTILILFTTFVFDLSSALACV